MIGTCVVVEHVWGTGRGGSRWWRNQGQGTDRRRCQGGMGRGGVGVGEYKMMGVGSFIVYTFWMGMSGSSNIHSS